ncbi:hypothetical protein HYH03_004998 [Edaphochlamys debaryana]|uniref:Uncharacterized protein n=1 Tax=Edaphochlamys debaryana TaxID=47281 RepID=A0A836C2R5_9CHLO|nr:hypothetical protein HYH03_004998 [Edaphochlamys debaryana]|eukprot:KAG2496993.1 hypothetical protein HYH03_004998 [Edaphochlamys debaryana]
MRRAAALRDALSKVDRSTARLKLQEAARPGVAPEQPSQDGLESPLDSEDDEHDPVLAELRAQRLADLQRQAAERSQRQRGGFGALNEARPSELMAQVEALDGPAVVHLSTSGAEECALLDELLTTLAHRHPGTWFGRVPVGRGEPLAQRLGVPGLPGLVCFRAGALVGRAPLTQFGPPGSLVEEEVVSYLQRLRVLKGEAAARRAPGQAAAEASSEEEGDGEDAEEWKLKPCELCGRRYPHEHVRAVYGRRGSSSGGEDD